MNAKYRLLLTFVLLFSVYYTRCWFTIFFTIGSFSLDITYLYIIFIIFYMLLEYREYKYKHANNQFYHFFYWFFFIILTVTTYIVTIQAFNYYINPSDFLINTEYFKLYINYSTAYMLYYIYKSFEILLKESLDMGDPLLLMEDIIKTSLIVQYIDVGTVISNIKTLQDLRAFALICYEISFKVFYAMPQLLEEIHENNDSEDYIRFLKHLLFVVASVKSFFHINFFACKTFVSLCIKDNLHVYIYKYLTSINVGFDPTMTREEIEDVCKLFAHKMLRKWNPIDIIRFVWDSLFL